MPFLRIAIIPDITEALRTPMTEKEMLLESTRDGIVARRIADLKFGSACTMQCALWVNVPAATIQALQTHLDERGMSYEVYEGDDSQAERDERRSGTPAE
ncbi:MAG: hypothetical protein V1876_01895 [Candidatus Peregrinibacteria bacterium]